MIADGGIIAAHGNVYFLTSHSNPIRDFSMRQSWTNLFDGERLLPRWIEVFLENPNCFVLAFDNVWPENWDYQYLGQAALWRKALAKLPPGAAHAIGHGNAERLWNLTRQFGRLTRGELFQYAVKWGSGRTREIHSFSKPGQGSRVA